MVVLSPNYASSSWCLDELSKIFYCMEARNRILRVSYDVDPSHARKQMGTFAEAFDRHEENFQEDSAKVRHWRALLTKLGNLAGWASKDRQESGDA
ncbi:TMV resistance protein N-like [Pyrus x bretschneideri]|uniref:TMV resistance protein N-like n=1 Tax=Pyrus x bretschneideri TaxID=225117 RepID=UPI00202EE8A2|nr:TMV resistance protein N-like [Pyrus x bretschneideri]